MAIFEDLGIQMASHSMLNSYLEKLLWILTGNFAKDGTMVAPITMVTFVADGGRVRVTTAGGSVTTVAEVSDTVRPGHVTLPNGLGVDYPGDDGEPALAGAPTNELTSLGHEDPFAGTPWHKHVPANVEAVG